MDTHLEFLKGDEPAWPGCGQARQAYDMEMKTSRHLNYFEHETYLHTLALRMDWPHWGVKMVVAPWAREGRGFTLLFGAYVRLLAEEMPFSVIAHQVDEGDSANLTTRAAAACYTAAWGGCGAIKTFRG